MFNGELPADTDGPDAVHEVHGLALLQAEENLDVAAAEERDGLGCASLGENFLKLINIGKVVV